MRRNKLALYLHNANLIKQIKGTSSHFVNEIVKPDALFKWQGSYGAFTVSRWDLDRKSFLL